jgi:predicted amidohydrolase YtcJ
VTHHNTVLHGGTILTFDGPRPSDAATQALGRANLPDAAGRWATAICCADDRILAIGTDAEVHALAGPDTHGRLLPCAELLAAGVPLAFSSGRLAPGYAADLVVLSGDPTGVPVGTWATGEDAIAVVAPAIAGHVVFGAL